MTKNEGFANIFLQDAHDMSSNPSRVKTAQKHVATSGGGLEKDLISDK